MTSSVTITGPGIVTASAYLGIPYGVPPIGPLRWQYSSPFKGSDLLQATAYGNECPQTLAPTASPASSSRCKDGQTLGLGESEDCLYLNVWVPGGTTAGSRLPVMVFIPGGAFEQGSGGAPSTPAGKPVGNLYDGTYLAATGKVIVVTLNYRLGALGFLARNGRYNFGFADQILALRWVQTNIAAFGGNPRHVTLFGESAGAKSVGLHVLASPKSAGFFQAAIMESNALGLPYKNASQSRQLSSAFCASSGPSLCTIATTACDLVEAQNDFMRAQPLSFSSISNLMWEPAVDNVYVTGQPIASAASLSVPLLLGTNHDEGVAFVYPAEEQAPKSISNPPNSAAYAALLDQLFGLANSRQIRSLERYHCGTSRDCTSQLVNLLTDFTFTCANRHLAIQATRGTHSQPLYLYQFNQVSSFNLWQYMQPPVPQCNGLVCHADEVPYVFNTAGQLGQTFTPPAETLAQTIGGHWTSFANSHDPGSSWPLFKPRSTYLLLSESSSTANDPVNASANCSTLWDGIGYETAETSTHLFGSLATLPVP